MNNYNSDDFSSWQDTGSSSFSISHLIFLLMDIVPMVITQFAVFKPISVILKLIFITTNNLTYIYHPVTELMFPPFPFGSRIHKETGRGFI